MRGRGFISVKKMGKAKQLSIFLASLRGKLVGIFVDLEEKKVGIKMLKGALSARAGHQKQVPIALKKTSKPPTGPMDTAPQAVLPMWSKGHLQRVCDLSFRALVDMTIPG